MAVLEIRRIGDPVLRAKSKPVSKVTKRVERLISDMVDTLHASEIGIGLSAPQVGVPERVLVADVGDRLTCLVNPVVVQSEGESTDVEGCLSIPDVQGYVVRPERVVVEGLDEKARPVRHRADGLLARCLQHEIDHLDGILIVDKITVPVEESAGRNGSNGDAESSAPAGAARTPREQG